MLWKVALGVLIALLATLPSGVSPTYGQSGDPAGMVSLTVQVGLMASPGAAMAPGAGTDAAPAGGSSAAASAGGSSGAAPSVAPVDPLSGVEVRVVAPSAAIATVSPEASVMTDANGIAQLQLTPGKHLVFVPRQDPGGPLGAMVMRAMPDGTLAPMWTEVDLSDGAPAFVTLVGTQLNP